MLKIIDSHCHLQLSQYDTDREEVIHRAELNGIGMICVGTNLETSKQAVELAQNHSNMWATIGIHPSEVSKLVLSEWPSLVALTGKNKVVGIGEIGLDYYRTAGSDQLELQKKVFAKQLDLAIELELPIIIHARDAGKGSTGEVHRDILEILNSRNSGLRTAVAKPGDLILRGVVHSFTGSTEDAKKYLEMGFFLGFNGIITFARQYNDVVRYVPLDRILVETDSPYLVPEPMRGQRNEPINVDNILARLAAIKEVSQGLISEVTSANCVSLFGLSNSI